MTSRNWVKLFITTLFIGGIAAIIVGIIIRWGEFIHLFTGADVIGIISTFLWLAGIGFIFSLISQMGFFAYLTLHRIGLGIFRSASLWNLVQLVLIAVVLFDLVYFRYKLFAEGEPITPYIMTALLVLVIGLIVSIIKVNETNKAAFIPTLFFMIVITTIEWIPVLRINDPNWLFLMFFTLIACNIYQILSLHKINEKSAQERQQKTIHKSS